MFTFYQAKSLKTTEQLTLSPEERNTIQDQVHKTNNPKASLSYQDIDQQYKMTSAKYQPTSMLYRMK